MEMDIVKKAYIDWVEGEFEEFDEENFDPENAGILFTSFDDEDGEEHYFQWDADIIARQIKLYIDDDDALFPTLTIDFDTDEEMADYISSRDFSDWYAEAVEAYERS